MNYKTKIIFIAIMLVAAVFLSGCVDSNSANESSQSSDKVTEKVDPVAEQGNVIDDKKMSVPEDNGNKTTNDTSVASSFNVTNTTNTTSSYTHYSSSGFSGSSSSKSSVSSSTGTTEKTQTVTDMMGRSVVLPAEIDNVVTVGSVPVINSFIEAMGEGSTISNGLPESFVKQGRWKYQYVFAPQIETAPVVQDSSNAPNIESIMQINPDVVFTMDKTTVSMMENKSINVVYLQWTNTTDVEKLMTLMGDIFEDSSRAEEYNQCFESKISEVNAVVESVPEDEKPKVLFCSPTTLTVPHKICEWWITEAGGIAVSENNRTTEAYTFDMEQLLNWNPDVIITQKPSDVDYIYNDTRFSDISAVENKQVYTTPVGAHVWGHRGIETPLMVEWAASKLYPDKITKAQMFNDTTDFYSQFFEKTLTTSQMTEILSGTAGTTHTISDMAGREVTVPTPENIQGVSCLHPIATYMTWRLAPEKLISIDTVFNSNSRLVPESANETLNSLPVTGVYFKGMNQEQMLALDPDVIVSLAKDPNLDQEQIDYDAPIMAISKDKLAYYEQSFILMGQLLGNEEEAEELAEYWSNSIEKVTDITSEIPEDQRLKVYYASHDGALSTVGPKTVMNSIINLAGGVCMYDTNTSLTSADQVNEHIVVNIEQVLAWNPDVIITKTEAEKNSILTDAQWQPVNAVQKGRVYAAPRWESLDGMQSIMGLMWTAEQLYPDKVTLDFNNETKAFYSEFYLYDNITDEQIAETVK